MRRSVIGWLTTATLLLASLGGADPARADTVVVGASDDASVEERSPTRNFDGEATLRSDESPLTRAVLGFDIGAFDGTVTRALLRLWVVDKSWNGPEVWTADTFDEAAVTWDDQPATGTRLADLGSITAGGWVEVDVTAAVGAPGRYAFALVPQSSDGSDFSSSEAAANRPELLMETTSSTTSTSTSTSSTTTTTTPEAPSSGTYTPVDDAYVEEAEPDANFGAAATLESDRSPVRHTLLAFRLPEMSKDVTRARLRLWVTSSTWNGPEVWRTSAFDEDSVTWRSAPAPVSQVADVGSVSSGRWLEIDVSGAVTDGAVSAFVLVPDSTDGADFTSKEGSASNRPQLVVETGDPPPPAAAFQIGIIGDTGYNSTQEAALLETRDDMADHPLAFAVHAGDIWGGSSSCSDSRYRAVRDVFDGFDAPFVYTPGDNEWKDCSGGSSGKLEDIRHIFFPTDETLGRSRMTVTRQSTFVENARWTREGVVFATINEPGSSGSSGSIRDAGLAWLDAAFDRAEDTDAPAVMIIWQDNPFSPSGGALYRRLRERAVAFGRPVVLVHGDTHNHRIDQPWSDAPHFTRVETFGTSSSGKWVRATIDPRDPDIFAFSTEEP